MSYLVLARKWRPQTFEDVVGQAPVVRTLQNALQRGRVAHAMIFSGVRGVGKTTLARLMAKALNCREGEPHVPCNSCDSCREIMAGSSVDLHEIDGASNRGIQEIRELKENIRFYPARAPFKVVIIDEVHMLTTEAFNALLKTLEEPPAHVYFMFATTELHKVPVTILSRCQRYELKRVASAELLAFFQKVSLAEGVAISDQALEMVAREAEGSIRDGLSLLDQVFSFGGDTVADEDVTQVLGLVDRRVFSRLAQALLAGDVASCLKMLDDCMSGGVDLKRFSFDLLGYFRALLIARITPQPAGLLDLSDRELAEINELSSAVSAATLHNYFQVLMKGIEEMQYASRPRLALEMVLIRAAQAGGVVQVDDLLAKLDAVLAAGVPLAGKPVSGNAFPAAPAVQLESESQAVAKEFAEEKTPPLKVETPAVKANDELPGESESVESAEGEDEVEEDGAADETVPVSPPVQRDVRRDWDALIDYVRERKLWMAHVLRLCAGVREEDRRIVLRFDDASDCKVLQEPDNMRLANEFMQDFFQRELRIQIDVRGQGLSGTDETEQDGPQEERRALASDPVVRMATEVFNGQVVSIRTGPRSR